MIAHAYAESGYVTALWDKVAYLCRYARQPFDVIMDLSHDDASRLLLATSRLIKQESGTGGEG